ncbi:MAG: O-antigen ligase family protein, partial [Planctomycetota bacterium]|nr:O-antigen ligase family protein [Planctomycetota bacterium]
LEKSKLLTTIDGCIAGLIVLVPLALGGRQAFGQLVLATLAIIMAGAWLILLTRKKGLGWDWTPITWLMLLGVGIVTLQTIPLGADVVKSLAPHLEELLPTWTSSDESAVSLGTWNTLSLAPAQTSRGLVTLISYVLVFSIVVQRVRSTQDVERIVLCIAVMAGAMAVFGLLQFGLSNGKFFWIYDHPYYSTLEVPKGSFGNQNHFAHFIVLGIAPIVYVVFRQIRNTDRNRRQHSSDGNEGKRKVVIWLGCGALVAIAFAVLRSESRGGVAVFVLMALMCFPLVRQAGKLDARVVGGLGAMGVILGFALMIYGDQFLLNRVDTLFSADIDEIDDTGGRRAVWAANREIIAKYPLTGTGVGTHVEVYPTYLDAMHDGREYTHAESGYLQVGQETGIPGLVLIGLCLLIAATWCVRGIMRSESKTTSGLLAVVMAVLVVNAAHSVADFMWYIPGCMIIVVILAACAQKLWLLVRDEAQLKRRHFAIPRPVWYFAVPGVLLLGGWMLQTKWSPVIAESHYYAFLRLHDFAGRTEIEDRNLINSRIASLVACTEIDPQNERAHLRLALEYKRLFAIDQLDSENRMDASQIRDTVAASNFESVEAMNAWLETAVGPSINLLRKSLRHTRRSLELCPVQGMAYVYLSGLAFLDGEPPTAHDTYMSQALLLRPFDAHVQFQAGKDLWLVGDLEGALNHWNACFQRHRGYQRYIIALMSEHVAAKFFLETFDPDIIGMEELMRTYKQLDRSRDMQSIRRVLASKYLQDVRQVSRKKALLYLVRAHTCFSELEDAPRAEACLEAALKLNAQAFDVRMALGRWRFKQGQFDEAAKHLSWCARQKFGDETIQRLADKALDAKLNPAKRSNEASTEQAIPRTAAGATNHRH